MTTPADKALAEAKAKAAKEAAETKTDDAATAAAKDVSKDPDPLAAANNMIIDLNSGIAKLRQEIEELKNNNEAKSVKIADLQDEIDTLSTKLVKSATPSFGEAASNVRNLLKAYPADTPDEFILFGYAGTRISYGELREAVGLEPRN